MSEQPPQYHPEPPPPNETPSLTGVLGNLRGFNGHSLALTNKIVDNPEINLVFLLGKPGIGKSTIAGQLRWDLRKRNHFTRIRVRGQDPYFQKWIKVFGAPPLQWTEDQCNIFSIDMGKDISRDVNTRSPVEDMWPGRRLTIVDLNGIAAQENFGFSTVRDLILAQPEETMVVPVVSDYRVQQRSMIVRAMALEIDRETGDKAARLAGFEEYLQSQKIQVVWLDKKMGNASSQERGEILLEKALHAANPDVIIAINAQVEAMIKGISETSRNKYVDILSEPKRQALFAQITDLPPNSAELQSIAQEAALYDARLGEFWKFGLPTENAILAFNFYTKDPVTWIISD